LINLMAKKNQQLCPCRSGKRLQLCCRKIPGTKLPSLTPGRKLEMRREVDRLDLAGRHREACEILAQLLAISPRNPLIWNDLGIQYEACGQTENALDALRRGHLCDATYPPILYNLGKFTLDKFIRLRNAGALGPADGQELLQQAAEFLNANLDRNPENADAHHNLALVHALGRDEARAKAHLTIASRLRQDSEPPLEWLLR
jgi:tetratricopeptide (TPR) repeat protein